MEHDRDAGPAVREWARGQQGAGHEWLCVFLSGLQRDVDRRCGSAHQQQPIRAKSQHDRVRVARRPARLQEQGRDLRQLGDLPRHLQRQAQPPAGARGRQPRRRQRSQPARLVAPAALRDHHASRRHRSVRFFRQHQHPRSSPEPSAARHVHRLRRHRQLGALGPLRQRARGCARLRLLRGSLVEPDAVAARVQGQDDLHPDGRSRPWPRAGRLEGPWRPAEGIGVHLDRSHRARYGGAWRAPQRARR